MHRAQTDTKQYSKRMPKNNKLQLRISDDDLEMLTSISIEDDESISQVVRRAIKMYKESRTKPLDTQ